MPLKKAGVVFFLPTIHAIEVSPTLLHSYASFESGSSIFLSKLKLSSILLLSHALVFVKNASHLFIITNRGHEHM